jgi:CDP-4-dehydro-6-deoxyglucose reductase, E1
MKKFFWPLMSNAIGEKEKLELINFIHNSDMLTNGKKVKEFEKKWSDWLGVKYSIYVSSGSTANFMIMWLLKNNYFKNKQIKVLSPSCTWSTNISTLKQLDIEFVLGDNDLYNFGLSEETLKEASLRHSDINVVWVTHLLGCPSDISLIKKYFPKAIIVEDCCESHGAKIDGKKVGTMGVLSSFSFYFGHHITTIEGGMVCTNDPLAYQISLMLRSHGMSRELTDNDLRNQLEENNKEINNKFLFPVAGFNFRNTEINAVIGIEQLQKLDSFISIRQKNLKIFMSIIERYPKFFSSFKIDGNSSMTLPFICKKKETKNNLIIALEKEGIETRPFLVGNVAKQPFLSNYNSTLQLKKSDFLHENAFYIGNNQFINQSHFTLLSSILEKMLG